MVDKPDFQAKTKHNYQKKNELQNLFFIDFHASFFEGTRLKVKGKKFSPFTLNLFAFNLSPFSYSVIILILDAPKRKAVAAGSNIAKVNARASEYQGVGTRVS